MSRGLATLVFIAGLATASPVRASDGQRPTDLAELSLEQLMNIEVTSVSKREEPLLHAASAIYVITQEDIRRSGLTSIPELLRLAPGVQVARIDGNKWAITVRGFDLQFSNKLLVIMDGRTVYDPVFSGVFWDAQDTLLEDIDRIEVIRGPGATLWGANAVNGVINIITKNAANTQGTLVTTGGGTEDRAFAGVRQGGTLGHDAQYRIYGKYYDRTALFDPTPNVPGDHNAGDSSDMLRGGFRVDWQASPRSALTVQGDIYTGSSGSETVTPSLTPPFQTESTGVRTNLGGGNLLGRWRYASSDRSDMALQVYYNRSNRSNSQIHETVNTGDIDFQHHFFLGASQQIVWGLGYRVTGDSFQNRTVAIFPDHRTYQLPSAFLQNEILVVPDRLRLTLGSKFEYNDFSGFEIQPSGRLLWTPLVRHALWAAISRAVRTPSRVDEDINTNIAAFPTQQGLPALVVLNGNPHFKSETLLAYELGYRFEPLPQLSFDVTSFYNDYDDLRTVETGTASLAQTPTPPHLLIPQQFANKAHGYTYGVETATNWQVANWWRLAATSTFLQMHVRPDASSNDGGVGDTGGSSPKHQFGARSFLNLPRNFEFDTALYYVDSLPAQSTGYIRLDTRLGWHPIESLELSLALQNLTQDHHLEFGDPRSGTEPTEPERSVYGKLTWRF